MIIKAYGLFWREDEIEWEPGRGNRDAFRLLGRIGNNRPSLRVADFRSQQGVYILYDQYGPYYVGLTRKQTLGKRLRQHREDEHAGKWERFSWFGFHRVLDSTDAKGFQKLEEMEEEEIISPSIVIGDIEALLIMAMGTRNKSKMNFANAERWEQIEWDNVDTYTGKLKIKRGIGESS